MLVLTRKPNQSIRIGDEIVVNIVKIKGNTIQLGIEAPRDISIVRSELLERDDTKGKPSHAPAKSQSGSSTSESSSKNGSEAANLDQSKAGGAADEEEKTEQSASPDLEGGPRIFRLVDAKLDFVTAV